MKNYSTIYEYIEVHETNVLNFKLRFNKLLFKHIVHVRNIFKYSIVFHP